jgi:hypothetical protein
MSAAETDSKLILIWLRILQEGERMIAAFEADHVGTPPITLVAPLEDRTRDAWIELWQDIMLLVIAFEKEYGARAPDDPHMTKRLADQAEERFAQLRHALAAKHPGLHAVAVKYPSHRARSDVDVIESLFAHLVDGVDPDDDKLDAMDEDALIRSGLSREAFIAARARLRGYVDELPEKHRRAAIATIKAARRRRS